MPRNLNPRLAKVHRTYIVEEIARRWGVHRNTVRQWNRKGGATIDKKRPLLVKGRDLGEFLICPSCECLMYRRVNVTRLDAVRGELEVRVTRALSHIGANMVDHLERILREIRALVAQLGAARTAPVSREGK